MKNRKTFKVQGQIVNVRIYRNKLNIASTFENKQKTYLTVNYSTIEEAREKFDKYDKDNANSFVTHFNNPYLINK